MIGWNTTKGIEARVFFPTSQAQPIRGEWYVLPVFPSVHTRRPESYELFYRGTVMAILEPNQRVLDITLKRAQGVMLKP